MQKIEIILNDFEPRPQERPRFTTFTGYIKTYETREMRDYKQHLRYRVKQELIKTCPQFLIFTRAIRISAQFLIMPPESWSEKKKSRACVGYLHKDTKPDLDNYIKALLDALNGFIWKDDNLICEIKAIKKYAIRNAIELTVEELE